MRTFTQTWYVAPLAGAAMLWPQPAAAQIDVNPPLPNVLLLIDTSGSMERMADGTLPATCTPLNTSSDLNRWGSLASVLTGTVRDRSCYAQPRNTAAFATEFGLGGNNPYDFGYQLPYHRILSGECVRGPGVAPVSLYDWPAGAIGEHKYNSTNACAAGEWDQMHDGLLDTFKDRVRFGLMTFDSSTHPGTGESGGAPNYASGLQGLWSYHDNWESGGTPAQGNPDGCGLHLFEVGARNPAAPPWEGRLISMGQPDATPLQVGMINEHIQEALLAVRPYGATPLAGMFEDAYTFFHLDDSMDPLNPSEHFAPAQDPYFFDGCRSTFIIVLSDGEPNLDLQPECDTGSGSCPYRQPYEVADALYNTADPKKSIRTFAVGFGLSSGTGYDCSTLSIPSDFNTGGACDGATGPLSACCNLSRIAYEGGTDEAYFADDMTSLRAALANVLALISSGSTSRTMPTFSSASAAAPAGAPAISYEFVSSFDPVTDSGLWEGNLERKRWICVDPGTGLEPQLATIDKAKGDDFAANVNEGKALRARRFITVVGDKTGGLIHSQRTMRPHVTGTDDGLGTYKGTTHDGALTAIASAVQSAPEAMELVPMPPTCGDEDIEASTSGQCANRLMTWNLGGSFGASYPSRSGSEFGAIYHSSPILHGTPDQFLRDESYAVFAGTEATRPLVLFTATTDGQLHGFKVASNDSTEMTFLVDGLENNELWSFLPPHVLPGIMTMFPTGQQILLDGQAIVQDVVFERTQAQAIVGGETGRADWRTVVVAGGGSAGGFYYALDVTDPTAPSFLWQLSTDATGNPLFGSVVGTPAIATIAYKDGTEVKEVAVAILAGGAGVLDPNPACFRARQSSNFLYVDPVNGIYRPRSNIRCWDDGPGRTVHIVRLSDGKVLATFAGKAGDFAAGLDATRKRLVSFDSPITGTPVPYPSQTGEVADRIYVGDADGTLWRLNLSDSDSANWSANLAFDAYSVASDTFDDGQPVAIPPVVAIDGIGNTVVLFATGDQERLDATAGMKARLWSFVELPQALGTVPFQIEPNWLINFENGKRVTGPLALFDEVVYFSTFTPTTAGGNVCVAGHGSIWGVDYLQHSTTASGPYPDPRLPVDPNAIPLVYEHESVEDPGIVVFGVAVTQVPSCYVTASVPDTYVGGTHTAITTSTPPSYQLVYQTGTGGTATQGSKTKTKTRVLPPLSELSRINSWASIIE